MKWLYALPLNARTVYDIHDVASILVYRKVKPKIWRRKNEKSFRSRKAHRAALISVPSALSQLTCLQSRGCGGGFRLRPARPRPTHSVDRHTHWRLRPTLRGSNVSFPSLSGIYPIKKTGAAPAWRSEGGAIGCERAAETASLLERFTIPRRTHSAWNQRLSITRSAVKRTHKLDK